MLNQQAIAPLGEACSNAELFRRLALCLGFDEECFRQGDEETARQAHDMTAAVNANLDFGILEREGWQRLNLPARHAPFANGGFPTSSGRCEFESEAAVAQGLSAVPEFIPPRESALADPELAASFPLMLLSPPARHYLNAGFSGIESIRRDVGEPHVEINPADAAARGIRDGDPVRVFNRRGAFHVSAYLTDRARQGVLVAPSIWWQKHSPDGENANAVTSDALTDIGRSATYYDAAVEVEREVAPASSEGVAGSRPSASP